MAAASGLGVWARFLGAMEVLPSDDAGHLSCSASAFQGIPVAEVRLQISLSLPPPFPWLNRGGLLAPGRMGLAAHT